MVERKAARKDVLTVDMTEHRSVVLKVVQMVVDLAKWKVVDLVCSLGVRWVGSMAVMWAHS